MPKGKEAENYDYLFKFIVIGDTDTGKSCLLHQFIENKFKRGASHTIGVEFGSKVIDVRAKKVKLQIWDTAGQERFRSVTRSYYRGAAAAIIVYDLTRRDTYNHLTSWMTDARTLANSDIVIIVVGNKLDLDDGRNREITVNEAARFAQENDAMFLETSALNGENVSQSFKLCADKIMAKIDSGEIDITRVTTHGIQANQRKTQSGSASGGSCPC
eukprot:GFYU01004438.1.p2 GENE.GFYU01004438.1~~GFYU01004438.1.p2  ORF type:complete len:215 (+),score=41.92 GFYU01004438.1:173-817(+)